MESESNYRCATCGYIMSRCTCDTAWGPKPMLDANDGKCQTCGNDKAFCACGVPQDRQQVANDEQVGGSHYRRTVSGTDLQHWDICWQLDFDQFQYCITKYVFRHKHKNGLEDLKKARHHLDKYIELLEAEK